MVQDFNQSLWWWAGDEASARRRFRERFGVEPTLVVKPQPGIVALGPVPEQPGDSEPQQMTFLGDA